MAPNYCAGIVGQWEKSYNYIIVESLAKIPRGMYSVIVSDDKF